MIGNKWNSHLLLDFNKEIESNLRLLNIWVQLSDEELPFLSSEENALHTDESEMLNSQPINVEYE